MPKIIRNNFTSGEVSPALRMRQDLALFESGLKTCKNVMVTPEGGVRSRFGSQMTYSLGSASDFKNARLIPFLFNKEQAYQVLFTPSMIAVFWTGMPVIGPGGPVVFTSGSPGWPGYTADEIQKIQYTQTLDVMLLAVEGKPVAALRRGNGEVWGLSSSLWGEAKIPPVYISGGTGMTLSSVSYSPSSRTLTAVSDSGTAADYTGRRIWIHDSDPASVFNKYDWDLVVTSATPASPSGVSITARLVSVPGPKVGETIPSIAAGMMFDASLVGDQSAAGTYKKDYYYRVTAVLADGRETPPSAVVSGYQINTLTAVNGLKFTWADWAGANGTDVLYYRVYKETSPGSGIFGWIGDANSTSYEDYNTAPLTSDNITSSEGIAVPNASATALYQQRMFMGGGGEMPTQITSSRTGDYFSLKTSSPIKDTDAFTFNLSTPSYEKVVSMVSMDRLYILTNEGIWAVGEGVNEVMTPTTFSAKKLSYTGASSIRPIVLGSRIMFVPSRRDRIYIASFGGSEGVSALEDVTLTARHLFDGHQIKEVVRRSEGGDSFWVLRDDGKLLVLTYLPDHKISAWASWELGGGAEAASLLGIPEARSEAVYAVLLRGNTATMERLTPPPFSDTTPMLDAWVLSERGGSPFTYIGGLGHLEGREVYAVADNHPVGPFVVDNGAIELDHPVNAAFVGLQFTAEIETFPIYPESNELGQVGQAVRARAHMFDDSPVRLYIGGQEAQSYSRDVSNGYGAPFVGETQDFDIPGNWMDGMTLRATADWGIPLRLLALELQIEY